MSDKSEKGLLKKQLEACRFNKCLLLLQCGKVRLKTWNCYLVFCFRVVVFHQKTCVPTAARLQLFRVTAKTTRDIRARTLTGAVPAYGEDFDGPPPHGRFLSRLAVPQRSAVCGVVVLVDVTVVVAHKFKFSHGEASLGTCRFSAMSYD